MIVILTEDDLAIGAKNKFIFDITHHDIKTWEKYKAIRYAEMVIYVDDDQNYKILKHRYPLDDERTYRQLELIGIQTYEI